MTITQELLLLLKFEIQKAKSKRINNEQRILLINVVPKISSGLNFPFTKYLIMKVSPNPRADTAYNIVNTEMAKLYQPKSDNPICFAIFETITITIKALIINHNKTQAELVI